MDELYYLIGVYQLLAEVLYVVQQYDNKGVH